VLSFLEGRRETKLELEFVDGFVKIWRLEDEQKELAGSFGPFFSAYWEWVVGGSDTSSGVRIAVQPTEGKEEVQIFVPMPSHPFLAERGE
jgi:hypothetical protein